MTTVAKRKVGKNSSISKWFLSQLSYANKTDNFIETVTMPLSSFYEIIGTSGSVYTYEHDKRDKIIVISGKKYNVTIKDYLSVVYSDL